MSNVTAEAPVRANCATEATTIAAGYSAMQTSASPSGQELDEHTVARVAAHLLRGVIAADERAKGDCASMYGSELAKQALGQLEVLITCTSDTDASAAFLAAAAMTAGALAYERGARPAILEFHDKLEQVFQVLDSANWSYSTEQAPCEALAVGVRTGAKQFSDPPIRRVAPEDAPLNFADRDVEQVFEVLAQQSEIVRSLAWKTREDAMHSPHERVSLNDLQVIGHISAFMGSICDTMIGGRHIGNPACWATGDGIEPTGGAA